MTTELIPVTSYPVGGPLCVYPYRGKWRGGFWHAGKWRWAPGKHDTKAEAFAARQREKARLTSIQPYALSV